MDQQAAIQKVHILSEISQQQVYLIGSSFVLGSMVTLFILLILDWVRRDSDDKNNEE